MSTEIASAISPIWLSRATDANLHVEILLINAWKSVNSVAMLVLPNAALRNTDSGFQNINKQREK